jgi:hypothetical protein
MPTFGAGTMPSSQGSCFIYEEQLGVASRRHHFSLSASEFEYTHDPSFHLPRSLHALIGVVEDSTVSQKRSAIGYRNDGAKGSDTILLWHGWTPSLTHFLKMDQRPILRRIRLSYHHLAEWSGGLAA